jgi:hypothetical protein
MLVQRGTNHASANRSNEPCIIAFVLIDANRWNEFAIADGFQ